MRLKTSTSPAPSFERQFLAEERGTMTTFTLFIFIIMIMVGGVAVDLMHFESERIRMQNTLDSAILAAADRDQDLSPKAVVMDYFDKAGLGDYISESDITVDQDTAVTYRTVSATASQTINTHFMKMTGIDTLDVPSSGTATESIGDLEISLVLDVSGSMKGTKIANLRSAAEQFVTKILAQSEDDTTSFSIVPYSTQVNVGSELLAQYTVNDAHNYSHCVNFDEDDFQSLSLSTSDALDQTAPTDGWYEWRKDSTDWDDRYETCMVSVWDTSITDPVTNTLGADTSREVIAFESDETVLHNYISTLPAYGNTSID
ncbi:MAG: pilus assembly protein TadG-related protein, partial [Hyphomicrobiales bacterium]